jgi:hypothetical protein
MTAIGVGIEISTSGVKIVGTTKDMPPRPRKTTAMT